ncbi:hypothetical protein NQ317_019049 [Molorchus minor]|uniref:Uncharacterized protein n=1 Tax=Molorchus minor TaxID=1323400 RepID=A0ABQ9JX69_9CUCU|nr:hypothetical protein NQ317_019049 [Molorchus minor]
MINAKLKRLEKSKINSSNVHLKPNGKVKINFKISRKGKLNKAKPNEKESANQMQNFSGITAKPGTIQKMRKKRKRNNMKKPLNERKQDFVKQPKQKIKKTREKDDFSKLVNKYKNIVQTAIPEKKKWYEQN